MARHPSIQKDGEKLCRPNLSLEAIQEVVASDESVVILCWRLIREGPGGSLNIALLLTAVLFVIRVI